MTWRTRGGSRLRSAAGRRGRCRLARATARSERSLQVVPDQLDHARVDDERQAGGRGRVIVRTGWSYHSIPLMSPPVLCAGHGDWGGRGAHPLHRSDLESTLAHDVRQRAGEGRPSRRPRGLSCDAVGAGRAGRIGFHPRGRAAPLDLFLPGGRAGYARTAPPSTSSFPPSLRWPTLPRGQRDWRQMMGA